MLVHQRRGARQILHPVPSLVMQRAGVEGEEQRRGSIYVSQRTTSMLHTQYR
jgi:hypothetical protein